jgi:hypothetical protein
MHFNIPAFTLALALFVLKTEARPDGAPAEACGSMTPAHPGGKLQSTKCPYVTKPEKVISTFRIPEIGNLLTSIYF